MLVVRVCRPALYRAGSLALTRDYPSIRIRDATALLDTGAGIRLLPAEYNLQTARELTVGPMMMMPGLCTNGGSESES